MLGYLNAENPFDKDGFYNTKDVVEKKEIILRSLRGKQILSTSVVKKSIH